jgi:hypothetical protein
LRAPSPSLPNLLSKFTLHAIRTTVADLNSSPELMDTLAIMMGKKRRQHN